MPLDLTADPLPLILDTQGTVRVAGSRVTLDLLIEAFQAGDCPEEIAKQISTLDLGDLHLIFGWYLHHRPEVDEYYEAGRRQAQAVRAAIEARWPPAELRARLAGRQRSLH